MRLTALETDGGARARARYAGPQSLGGCEQEDHAPNRHASPGGQRSRHRTPSSMASDGDAPRPRRRPRWPPPTATPPLHLRRLRPTWTIRGAAQCAAAAPAGLGGRNAQADARAEAAAGDTDCPSRGARCRRPWRPRNPKPAGEHGAGRAFQPTTEGRRRREERVGSPEARANATADRAATSPASRSAPAATRRAARSPSASSSGEAPATRARSAGEIVAAVRQRPRRVRAARLARPGGAARPHPAAHRDRGLGAGAARRTSRASRTRSGTWRAPSSGAPSTRVSPRRSRGCSSAAGSTGRRSTASSWTSTSPTNARRTCARRCSSRPAIPKGTSGSCACSSTEAARRRARATGGASATAAC